MLVQVGTEWEEGEVDISWTNPNTPFVDGSQVPLELRLYKLTDQETPISKEMVSQTDMTHSQTRIAYDKFDCGEVPCKPWDLAFSLVLAGQAESSVQGLLDSFSLLPPEKITVECEETCLVTWCFTDKQHLQVNTATLFQSGLGGPLLIFKTFLEELRILGNF